MILPFLLNGDVVFVAKKTQGFHIGKLIVFHHKTDHISCLAASKTFKDSLGGGYRERGGLLVVKRATGHIIGTPSLQSDVFANDCFNGSSFQDTFYSGLADHQKTLNPTASRTSSMVARAEDRASSVPLSITYFK